jgi:hypothetical protein
VSTIQPRTSTVTIYTDDYLDRIRHLEAKAEALDAAIKDARKDEEGQPVTMMDAGNLESVRLAEERDALAQEHDALVAEAEEKALHVKVKALKRSEWRALKEKHPARKDNDGDEFIGANEDTFKEEVVPLSIVEPADFTEDDLDALAHVDFERLWVAVYRLNALPGGDPKASLVSRLTQPSGETSN